MATIANISDYIGVEPKSEFELAALIESGLPIDKLTVVREWITFSEVNDLIISARTQKHRKTRGQKLSAEETDRLVRVIRVLALAFDVFGSNEKALLWLRTPDDRLDNRSPMSMLHTEAGGRLVEEMLWQIDEGVYT
jgi:putative toxin-antitoxin system antitoxin component (TIGR02293 family)